MSQYYQSYGAAAGWAWFLLIGTCIFSLIPVVGFLAWIVGGATILIAIVLAVIVLTRGGTTQGVMILLASLLGVPLFILLAPIVTTAIFSDAIDVQTPDIPKVEAIEQTESAP